MSTPNVTPLREFVTSLARLIDQKPDEPRILKEGGALLKALVSRDDWLPDEYAQPHPQYYQQYLLHADSAERFSIVSFVWGPGQFTPVHDHTVWGLIGMLRGEEWAQPYELNAQGVAEPQGQPVKLLPGQVEAVSPTIGDIHRVSNGFKDKTSISIHVYGGNIGAVKRHVFPEAGGSKAFISGYSNTRLPNLWDRSKEAA